MPEETASEVAEAPGVEETPINAEVDVEEIAAQADKPDAVLVAIKREQEKRRKMAAERDEALAKVKEYEDAQKSEAEKREEALAESQKELEALRNQNRQLEVRQLRATVAAEKNLPPKLADRLTGETVEEIQADADALLEDLGPLSGETPPPGDGGARTPVPPKDLDDQIAEAERKGDFRTSMSLKNQKLLLASRA